jgi:poly(hydroxyalkanoate) depolymerase family esterase
MRRTALITLAVCGAALAIAVVITLASPSATPGTGRYRHARLSVGADDYGYAVYDPSSRRPGVAVPLVVVIHGCSTTADQQAAASSYDQLAQQRRFVVLYPDVDAADQAYHQCWKGIWEPATEKRGHGDAGAIAAMTRAVVARWHIDRTRIYAIGISAGAFESAILGADYPDLYAAIGIHSGAAYLGGESGCLAEHQSPTDTAVLARAAADEMGRRARVMPVIVLHGDQDDRVPYRCGTQALAQWLRTDDLVLHRRGRPSLESAPSRASYAGASGGHPYTVLSYADRSGCVIGQIWTVHGMGHAWSGGSADLASARFTDPRGPSAAAASWAFFARWGLSGPLGPCASALP